MDKNTGGLSPSERQRQTAAEIAKNRVLAAYSHADQKAAEQAHLKDTNTTNITAEEWRKYHSAWQTYYQRYYSEYYTNAARNYIAKEKLKVDRAAAEDERILREAGLDKLPETNPTTPTSQIHANSATGAIAGSSTPDAKDIRSRLRGHIRERAKKQVKNHHKHRRLIPILAGVAVVLVFLFLQYNRLIFAPIVAYVSPGNDDGSSSITPVDPSVTQHVSAESRLIIPKLNVDVPVHFGISNDEKTVMSAMNNGVAQFSIPGASAMPGENGNLVITGHSAGDIYSNNQYKFIFSGLERLADGDTIYINYNSVRYTYTVTGRDTVKPSDVTALTQSTGYPQLILVTCTPLGTSNFRLLIFAKQINPAPDEQAPTQENNNSGSAESMPSNEDTFFESIWKFLTGQS